MASVPIPHRTQGVLRHLNPVDEVAALFDSLSVPFCFVSGYGRENLPQGFDHAPLIEKPFRPDTLRTILTALLARGVPDAAE